MESIATSVAEKVAESLVARIGRHLGYLFNYRSNILDLTQQIEKLRDGRVRMQQSVDEANRQGDEIFPDVEKWLSRAEEIIKEADKFVDDEREANRGCFNLKLRYQGSKKAKNQAGDIVNKVQEADKFGTVAHRPPPPGIGSSSLSGSEVFKSRERTLNQIMEALRDDDIGMVGVWGMGGVGKTTLVRQVAKLAQEAEQGNGKKLFDKVVMSLNISQTLNVTKIQEEIASMLGLKFEVADQSGRAVQLSQSLKNHLKNHKKILVILDDIWEPIEFETIGIPYGSDDHRVGCCKVLLTSREHHVLSKDMGTHKDFHVQHLCKEEAWRLFKKTAGDSVEKPELQPIATEVVKECEGLPVAIVTIARALKGESVAVWSNALEELRRTAPTSIRGVSKNVYACLELSYNHLESDEVKSLFLLCGLLGDGDISLDDLLKYCIGLDMFDYIHSLEQARNKLLALVEILKASSLLLEVEDGHYHHGGALSLFFVEEDNMFVRMHDVVRDVAKAIASKDPHQFVVKEDVRLQEWQKRDGELRNCTGISLKCTHVHELPEGLVCPKLEFFLLNGNDNSLKIPDIFFKEMKEVRVLSLLRIDLTQLPSSLRFLSNLRTLCLHGCGMLKDIAILGELKKLQILSLVDCRILEFPKEMMQLTDLRMLSLRDCSILVPRNVIPSLSRLEHLCMRNSFYKRESKVVEGGERNARLSEFKYLSCLRALKVEIPHSSFENLPRYDIFIGDRFRSEYYKKTSRRRLTLNDVKGSHLVKCFSKLLKITEVLDLTQLNHTKHFVYDLDSDGFLQLKYLSIFWSDDMQYIMNTMDMEWVDPPHSAFPLLEKLKLRYLDQLEAVCHGPIPMGCFANLRLLIIECCCSLKCILWLPTTLGRESVLVFPQLRFLKLNDLPNLIDFYSVGTSGSQEQFGLLFNQQVALPMLESLYLDSMDNVRTVWDNQHPVGSCCKLKELCLNNCKNLLTVVASNFIEWLQSPLILEKEDCRSLKEIVEVGEINSAESDGIAVPTLKELSLHSQNKRSVKNKDPQGYLAFQNLNSLKVDKCTSLKYLFPASMVKGLVQLEVLEISDCGVEEIVANENGVETMPMFLFPRLTSLKLTDLDQLKSFYRKKYTLACPLLETLEVCNCDKVELLFQEKSLQGEVDRQPLFLVEKNTFPNVEELKLGLKGPMEIWRGQFSRESFGKLRVLEIKGVMISQLRSTVKEMVGDDGSEATDDISYTKLEKLQIEHLVNLKSFSLASNTLEFPSLEEIELEKLPRLTHLYKIIPGFGQNLQKLCILKVSGCGNLEILLTLSMAKTLVQLKELTVDHCDELKEIVENEGGEATDDEIIFTKLQTLELGCLPNLKSFCAARCTIRFPSLTEMEIMECPKMEFFCKGDAITLRLKDVHMNYRSLYLEHDLNAIIQEEFMETHRSQGRSS